MLMADTEAISYAAMPVSDGRYGTCFGQSVSLNSAV